MKRYSFILATAAVLAMTIVAGVVDGRYANRWNDPAKLDAAAARLAAVPMAFGAWEAPASKELAEDVVSMLQCKANFDRGYVNSATNEFVRVTMIVGPPGPTSAHTPEVCYSAHDFERLRDPEQFSAPGSPNDNFWEMTFLSRGVAGATYVAYGWNSGESWQAPAYPRFTFAGAPYLYKLQLAVPLASKDGKPEAAIARKFLADFLPLLKALKLSAGGGV